MILRTTRGVAAYKGDHVTIAFGVLDAGEVRNIELDVTAYVVPLIRDLATAAAERDAAHEEDELQLLAWTDTDGWTAVRSVRDRDEAERLLTAGEVSGIYMRYAPGTNIGSAEQILVEEGD